MKLQYGRLLTSLNSRSAHPCSQLFCIRTVCCAGQESIYRVRFTTIMIGLIQIEVQRSKNESSTSLIRRFSRRAKDASLVQQIRSHRYQHRKISKNIIHRHALSLRARREKYHELVKLGKIDPTVRRGHRHH